MESPAMIQDRGIFFAGSAIWRGGSDAKGVGDEATAFCCQRLIQGSVSSERRTVDGRKIPQAINPSASVIRLNITRDWRS